MYEAAETARKTYEDMIASMGEEGFNRWREDIFREVERMKREGGRIGGPPVYRDVTWPTGEVVHDVPHSGISVEEGLKGWREVMGIPPGS